MNGRTGWRPPLSGAAALCAYLYRHVLALQALSHRCHLKGIKQHSARAEGLAPVQQGLLDAGNLDRALPGLGVNTLWVTSRTLWLGLSKVGHQCGGVALGGGINPDKDRQLGVANTGRTDGSRTSQLARSTKTLSGETN